MNNTNLVRISGRVIRFCADAGLVASSFAFAMVLRYVWAVEVPGRGEEGTHS
jgi:hypothetical protein